MQAKHHPLSLKPAQRLHSRLFLWISSSSMHCRKRDQHDLVMTQCVLCFYMSLHYFKYTRVQRG